MIHVAITLARWAGAADAASLAGATRTARLLLCKCRRATERPKTAPTERGVNAVKRAFITFGMTALTALVVAGIASAAPTIPAVPVSSYGDSLLSALGTAVGQVFPYAAAITAFAIGVGLVRRWLGAKKATKV